MDIGRSDEQIVAIDGMRGAVVRMARRLGRKKVTAISAMRR
jgi:hypothetical protein